MAKVSELDQLYIEYISARKRVAAEELCRKNELICRKENELYEIDTKMLMLLVEIRSYFWV